MGIFNNRKKNKQSLKPLVKDQDYVAKIQKEAQESEERLSQTLKDAEALVTEIDKVPERQVSAAQEGKDIIMKHLERKKNEENKAFESSYAELRAFLQKINDSEYVQAVTQQNKKENVQEGAIVPIDEQVRRYNNLHAKGYIDDPITLMLPFVEEKWRRGLTLSEDEQALLDEKKRIDDIEQIGRKMAQCNLGGNVLKLQAIGVITDYKSIFSKLYEYGIEPSNVALDNNGKLISSFAYEEKLGVFGLRNKIDASDRDSIRGEIIRDLIAEANSSNDYVESEYLENVFCLGFSLANNGRDNWKNEPFRSKLLHNAHSSKGNTKRNRKRRCCIC